MRPIYKIQSSDYKNCKQINKGAYGNIYEVEEKATKKKYAAKVIKIIDENDKDVLEMIKREVSIMMRVVHPTIVRFYGYCEIPNKKSVMILMELFKRGSLDDLLKEEQKSLADPDYDNTIRQIILIGISYGMMKLHQKHVIHRDLKPGNILIDNEFYPHIADFGLSKIYDADGSIEQSKVCGTPIYMAPEINKTVKYNGKVDVYSFGIIMYQVVTGQNPYPLYPKQWSEYILNKKVIDENYRPQIHSDINDS